MHRLPPLNALKAFESAARHGGFVGASDELNVSRGAISRHIKLLEAHLGVELFTRHAQGVRLTADGKRLAAVLSEAFGQIAQGVSALKRDAADLRVLCPPSTSIRWLLPKLEDFRRLHPGIRLRLTTDFYAGSRFDPGDFDIGFSVENWPRKPGSAEIETLFPALLTPACAPSYRDALRIRAPEDLTRCELLHETAARRDWRAWLDAFQPAGVDINSGQVFPNLDMATKAAEMGAGVVMADLALCRDEFERGALVEVFDGMRCPSPFGGVCLIGSPDRWTTPGVRAFRAWAVEAARADRDRLTA